MRYLRCHSRSNNATTNELRHQIRRGNRYSGGEWKVGYIRHDHSTGITKIIFAGTNLFKDRQHGLCDAWLEKPLKNLDNITWSNKRRVPIKRRVPDKRRGSRSFVLINAGGAYSRIYGICSYCMYSPAAKLKICSHSWRNHEIWHIHSKGPQK